MNDSARQEPISTIATVERVERLLPAQLTRHVATDGYLDTLPGDTIPAPGRAQAAWQTDLGSAFYAHIQPLAASLLAPGYRGVAKQLNLEPGQTVADVGCGPGNVTVGLADTVAPHGLAVGLDLSAPMLRRAATQARPNMGLVRGDATRLPFRDASVDAACATAVVMLVPEPAEALAELIRIVAPGGWLFVMAPSLPTGLTAPLTRPATKLVGRFGGARMFGSDDLGILLEHLGCTRIHSQQHGNMTSVRARVPTTDSAKPISGVGHEASPHS